MLSITKGAEPYLLPAGKKGVLLVHGFTGSPAEMRLLGEYLHEQNFTVLGVRLPGHGTTVEELSKMRWKHWYGAVLDGFNLLRDICAEVSVVGLSMGGLLALKLAAEEPVDKVVAMSAPVQIFDKRVSWLPLCKYVRAYIPKRRKHYDVDPKYTVNYDRMPLKPLDSMLKAIGKVMGLLPLVQAPALIIQSRSEHTVRPESAQFIYDQLGSKHKELLWLEKSGHIITLDEEREQVFAAVEKFLVERKDDE